MEVQKNNLLEINQAKYNRVDSKILCERTVEERLFLDVERRKSDIRKSGLNEDNQNILAWHQHQKG